ncbi:MAG: PTS sugar transporter subunit IIA [Spirochaetes bacterium]|nr:PTS sugar transporter subunit IIA [Spirochaetota bacterium]
MLVSEIFKPDNIKISLESDDKEELFEEIVNFLADSENLDNRDEILESLWERERKMTTGIAPKIAIPHTKLKGIDQTLGVMGISEAGIDYDSLDGNPVHLVMLLIGNEDKPEAHLQVLKKLATLLSNPEFYERITSCSNPNEVSETIIEFEEEI